LLLPFCSLDATILPSGSLSINSQEFITAKAVVDHLKSLQQATSTIYLPCIMARHVASTRTSLAGSRVLFNQIRLISEPLPNPLVEQSPTTIVPVGCKVVSSPKRPDSPKHFGQTVTMPFASDRRDALFQNYATS
jgi:hypothetical protein